MEKRSSFEDKRSGPKSPKSVLTKKEQAIICEFRRITKLHLDDIFVALKKQIPKLSRSNLYRCLRRNKLNILPKEKTEKRPIKKFKNYAIGFVHVDIAQVQTKEGKAYLFVGVDRKTRSVYAEIMRTYLTFFTLLFCGNFLGIFNRFQWNRVCPVCT